MIELFSKRQAKLTAPPGEVYVYESVPAPLRNKIIFIVDDALGDADNYGYYNDYSGYSGFETVRDVYKQLLDFFRREHGLQKVAQRNYREAFIELFQKCEDLYALDLIELAFIGIDKLTRKFEYMNKRSANKDAQDAIDELNHRFQEHNIGYKFESGKLIRIDSQFAHQEIIKPALLLLREARFIGANDEFLKAHEDYRKGDYRDCVHKACQAFESMMKVICKSNSWEFDQNAPAKKLIAVLIEKGLIKSYSESSYNALVSLLESAIPTPRNKEAGHGQGETIKTIPGYLASHILNLTASTMLYLIEAEKDLKKLATN